MIVAGALVVVSFAIPFILTWPNRLWTRFGLLLHRVTNPIILGILFVLVFVPMALWLRLARRQPIRRLSDDEETFWRKPDSGTVDPDSFRKPLLGAIVKILGISAFYHDSAAALIEDGEIIAAAQQERFSRKKHDAGFPDAAIHSCLEISGTRPADLDYVAFYDKPFVKFERLLETYLSFAPRGFSSFRMAIPVWLKEKLFLKTLLLEELGKLDEEVDWRSRLRFSEHHLSHAASAFYPSPFDEALILSMDGVGEWATTSVYHGKGRELTLEKEIRFPDSLGLLYSAFTYYLGFKVNSGEYKVMGLAPYGEPKYRDLILEKLLIVSDDGSFHLDQGYFNYCVGLTMVNQRFVDLFGQPVRDSEGDLEQFHMDIAASVQAVTEEIVLRITRSLSDEYPGIPNLCLAGGVALNCVANGKVIRDGRFSNVWVQPAAGDAGGAPWRSACDSPYTGRKSTC